MFKVSLSAFFFIYLTLSLVGIFVSWVCFELRKKTWRFNPLEKSIFRCKICAHSYIIEMGVALSKCPQCGSYNDVLIESERK